jgi:hypothetical protein
MSYLSLEKRTGSLMARIEAFQGFGGIEKYPYKVEVSF